LILACSFLSLTHPSVPIVHSLFILLYCNIRSSPRSPLFPYTTLFRSHRRCRAAQRRGPRPAGARRAAMRGRPWFSPVLSRLSLRSEEHTSELQSLTNLVCRLLLEIKKIILLQLSLRVRHYVVTLTLVM